MFTVVQKGNSKSRGGLLKVQKNDIATPTFMPDGTRGAVKSLTPEMVVSTGVQVVLANTYHLHLKPGEDTVAALGGLHEFTKQPLPLLTDSGGFQVFSLSHSNKISEDGVRFKDPSSGDMVFLSPEKSIQIQIKMGADMLVAFDDVVSLDDASRGRRSVSAFLLNRSSDRIVGSSAVLQSTTDSQKICHQKKNRSFLASYRADSIKNYDKRVSK